MKKSIKALLLACMMLATGVTGCGSETDGTAAPTATGSSTAGTTTDAKILKVGMECAYAPFNWTQEKADLSNGELALPIYGTNYYAYGYDVMVAMMLAEELGYDDVEIHRCEWDSLGMGLNVGDFDCIIAGMSVNETRQQVYDFTDTYYIRDTVITTKVGSEFAGFTSLADFAGVDVEVTTQLGTAWVNLIDQIPDAVTLANYVTTAECFLAVSNGTADITVIDLPTTQSALLTNTDLVMIELADGFDDTTTNVCIAVRKGDDALRESLNTGLAAVNWDKTQMDELMEKAIVLQPAAN